MTASGYLNQRQRHPVAMTAAIAINLGAVTALMLAKTEYAKKLPTVIWARNIPLPTPPEPVPIRQPETAEAPRKVYVPLPTPAKTTDEQPEIGEPIVQPRLSDDFAEPLLKAGSEPKPEPLPVLTDALPLPGAARDFQPPYPPQLLRMTIEGKAVVRVLSGTDGRVKQVAVIAADDPLFGEATERQALRKWRFRPATRDGVPTESWKQLTVRFEIR